MGNKEQLMSNTELLQENRSRGWCAAVTAPKWAQERILEIRNAIVNKREIPPASRAFNEGCERRSMGQRAVDFGRKLFRSAPDAELESLRQRAFVANQTIAADFRAAGLPVNATERAAENAKRRERVKDIADQIREMGESL
jgi:hypothetical protein